MERLSLKMANDVVALRNRMSKKRPNFYKQSSYKKKKLDKKWRKPRGSDSKIKIRWKGRQPMVEIGYRGPSEARGLSREGYNIVPANNINDLKNVNKSKDIICIGGIGMKKKIEIVKECVKIGLKIMNVKNPQKFLDDNEQNLKKKKDEKAKKLEEKSKKSAAKEAKKDSIEEKIGKEEEKKEKDKVLTKREL